MSALDLKSKSFSLANARGLVIYARMAYDEPPTIQDKQTDTQVLIRELDDCVVVAFRGTSSVRDFITDAKAWQCVTPMGGIHQGFWEAWLGTGLAVYSALQPFSFKPVFICGHSLGGALAMIAARMLRQNMVNVHSVYTFGSPRVGDRKFQAGYNAWPVPGSPFDNLGDATFTLIHDCDLVPRLPGYFSGYRRPGHDDFLSPLLSVLDGQPCIAEDPSVTIRLASDMWSLAKGWVARKGWLSVDKILTDHHVDNYVAALNAIPSSN